MNTDYLDNDDFQRELIWALSHCTDLTQEEIADYKFVQKSQASVSRTLNEYDPAIDGFEYAAIGAQPLDDISEEYLQRRREAIAKMMETSPMLMSHIGLAKFD
jgi:hypothetical protein